MHHVYLVPGFFGFASFGEFKYFAHVRDHLAARFRQAGVEAAIHDAPTFPTKSIRKRAIRLVEIMRETAHEDDGPIHVIGHSTGGLDARLAVSPHATLAPGLDAESLVRRVRTVVAVATPHHGSPLAGFFTSMMGQRLLQLLSLVTVHTIRLGSLPLPAVVLLAGALSSSGVLRHTSGILDQVYRQVLQDFDQERQREIEEYFEEARRDQSLLIQLTPEGLDLFDALVGHREGVREGSVITRARPPGLKRQLGVGLSPGDQAGYGLFRALYGVASQMNPEVLPMLSADQTKALLDAYGELPNASDNDTMVPTRSQIWGEVIHASWADHLDVIGHFHAPDHAPLHVDWLHTGSGFGRREFEALWDDVAGFLFDEAATSSPRS